MVQAVLSDDGAVQLEATTQFRKLLSIGETLIYIIRRLDNICPSCIVAEIVGVIITDQ
jgi:hypothetical protein